MRQLPFNLKFGHAAEHGTKSSVLTPLGWLMAILITALVGLFKYNAPQWVTFLFGGFCVLNFVFYSGFYIYFVFTDREALRTESYSLEKLRIEKGLYGDSTQGFIENNSNTPLALPGQAGDEGEAK